MLTPEQKRALSDILAEYWHEADVGGMIDEVVKLAGPAEAASYLEEAASNYEKVASQESMPEASHYYTHEARKFREVAKLLRTGRR